MCVSLTYGLIYQWLTLCEVTVQIHFSGDKFDHNLTLRPHCNDGIRIGESELVIFARDVMRIRTHQQQFGASTCWTCVESPRQSWKVRRGKNVEHLPSGNLT